MAVTINADTLTGAAVVTSDASGQLELQAAGVTKLTVASGGVTLASPLPVASGGTGGTATPTAGGIVYGTGTVQAVTAAGSSGQVLTSAGASAPTWATPSSSWVTLGSGTVSGSPTTIDFETGFTDTTYSAIVIMLIDLRTVSSNGNPTWRFKQAGSYTATDYEYQNIEASGSTITTYKNTSQTGMVLAGVGIDETNGYSDMLIVKNRFSATAGGPSIATYGIQQQNSSKIGICQGVRQTGGAVQGARLYITGGGGATTFGAGSYVWYGIRAS